MTSAAFVAILLASAAGTGGPAYALSIDANTRNYNIASATLAAGWDGYTPCTVYLTIASGKLVGSSSTTLPALRCGTQLVGSAVYITNNGLVYGAGGTGSGESGLTTVGGNGGDAFWSDGVTCEITNNGTFAGGGGGGGKGQYRRQTGGGGGAEADGGWGGGGQGDRGGNALTGSYPSGGSAAHEGNSSAPGNGGNGGVTGSLSGGAGGNGGGLGQNGQSGQNGSGGNQSTGPYAGGSAGRYLAGSGSVTWAVAGTRLGGVS